jgi:hypothetical protein
VKIIKGDNFNVYVYPEDHAPPHCHIRYKGNEPESVVGLPLFNLIAGVPVSKPIKKVLRQNINKLTKAWDQLNPNK